jgi:L-lactate dehydrogenase complex protein LldG
MSREKIIAMIRMNAPVFETSSLQTKEKIELPAERLKELFIGNLRKVGAEFAEVNDEKEISALIEKDFHPICDFRNPDVWKEYQTASLEKLDQIDTVLLEGQFGVAENGAIWLDETNFPNRLIPFIAWKVFLILNSEQIVEDMHQAYHRIQSIYTGFGVFISGPSKTADIEQSLVYGAHGPVSLTVIMHSGYRNKQTNQS